MQYATLKILIAESGISKTRWEHWMKDMREGYHYAQEKEGGTRLFHRHRVEEFINARLFKNDHDPQPLKAESVIQRDENGYLMPLSN